MANSILNDTRVKLSWYEVNGATASEIRDSLRQHGPADEKGVRRYAHTRWKISWAWPATDQIAETQVSWSAEVTLPRWKIPETATIELREQWVRMFKALLRHEANHLQFARGNFRSVQQAIVEEARKNPKITALEANRIAHRKLDEIRALDREYDRKTKYGATEGVTIAAP